MSKEIKFRGKVISIDGIEDIDIVGTYVYGSYIESKRRGNWHIIQEKTSNKTYYVDATTVGQYITIDQNNKEIYCGDNVMYKDKIYEVRTNEDYCGYELDRSLFTHGENKTLWLNRDIACCCEVIDNIK